MANFKTGLTIDYITDFGTVFKNNPVKLGASIPDSVLAIMSYDDNSSNIANCSGSVGFKVRKIKIDLANGSTHRLTANLSDIAIKAVQLIQLPEVICVAIEGETWGTVPDGFIQNPTYKTDPWTGIADKKVTESFTYNYLSDLVGSLNMATAIETTPTELLECQKKGLKDISSNKNACTSNIPIEPRRFYIKSLKEPKGKVNRQAIVSERSSIASIGSQVAVCGNCVGYKGESIKNVVAAGLQY